MKIELKKIAFYERMSEETNAFTADIYVNGVKTGYAKNDGRGGCTWYHAFEGKENLLKEAEAYAKTLPPIPYDFGDRKTTIEVDLEFLINDLLEKHLATKENAKFAKKREKACLTNIVYGVENGASYKSVGWKNFTIEQLLKMPKGVEAIKNAIVKVKGELKEGEKILNKNIPEELLK